MRLLAAALLLLAAPAGAATIVIDFSTFGQLTRESDGVVVGPGVRLSEASGHGELNIVAKFGNHVLAVGDEGGASCRRRSASGASGVEAAW